MKFSSALLSIAALAGVASAATFSNSTSATSSSASASSTATPYIIGYEQNSEPYFAIHIPTSLNFNGFNVLSLEDTFPFNPSANAISLVSGSSSTPYTGFSDDSSPGEIDVTFPAGDYSSYSEVVFYAAGSINGVPGSYTGSFALTLNPTGLKREEKVYYLSATAVVTPKSSSPSSSSPSSTLSDYTLPLSTIYSTVIASGSTTVTVTCTKASCSGAVQTVVTGVTTVTHGTTIYTTYCPLTTTETYIPVHVVSTVYQTVACTASATTVGTVTTGVITVTKGATVYTTYCPISSTYNTVQTHYTTVSRATSGSTVISIPVTVASHANVVGTTTTVSAVVSSAVYVKVGVTTTPVPAIATTLASTTSHPAAAPSVSILSGAAGKQAASAGLLGAAFIAAFFY